MVRITINILFAFFLKFLFSFLGLFSSFFVFFDFLFSSFLSLFVLLLSFLFSLLFLFLFPLLFGFPGFNLLFFFLDHIDIADQIVIIFILVELLIMSFSESIDLFLYFLFLLINLVNLLIKICFDFFCSTGILRLNFLLIELLIQRGNLSFDGYKLTVFLADCSFYLF